MKGIDRVRYGTNLSSLDANKQIGNISMFSKDMLKVSNTFVKRVRKYDRARVRRFLTAPYSNTAALQEISEYLMMVSGNYFRIVEYLSGMATFDHLLTPSMERITDIKENSIDEFLKIAHLLKSMKIKKNFRWFLKELIINGEIYCYKIKSSGIIQYVQIPNNLCRVSAIEDGVYRYDFKIDGLKDSDVVFLPQEFQRAIKQTEKAKKSDGWIRISDSGFCFNLSGAYPKGLPMLSFMFDDIMGLEDVKDLIENKTKLDTVKLIHLKIPLNEKNVPVFNMETARMYHEATKRNLPDGVAVTTNPLEISHVPFEKAQSRDIDAIERSERNLWNSAGISDLLFSNDKTGGEIMKLSVIADEIMIYPILRCFEDYINSEINSKNFTFKFLDVTYFNKKEKTETYEKSMYAGGSRLPYLASLGNEPYEIISTLTFEQNVLDIDNLMIPKKTSHTLTENDNGGRPTNEEVGKDDSDNTELARERE